ncbi:MAG: sugar-binding transcriptional regulator [Leptolinea sp.]|jgi:DNA-binding transcriptional regulator LsrR (DeoR family)|nr:sugar-binding transcriptional regulator [Leptolinea sp.]
MNMIPSDYESSRLISRILMMYYMEDKSQAEIGQELGLSTAKINRLLKQARNQGYVEINIHSPFQHLIALEKELESLTGLKHAVVVPKLGENEKALLQSVGRAAAIFFLEHLRDGDIVCMGGGTTLSAMVESIPTEQKYSITVVPASGGVQGRHDTDVNSLVFDLATKLGAKGLSLHAPAVTDSTQERDNLLAIRQVHEVLDLANHAQIALIGIGAIRPATASLFQFASLSNDDISVITQNKQAAGEMLMHVLDHTGKPMNSILNQRIVGLEMEELKKIPLTIGIAATQNKVIPIIAALKGGYLKVLITDEETAKEVLAKYNTISQG